ncbi:MAG: FkbM family methyltransferase, partial [Terriglobales bacterium]
MRFLKRLAARVLRDSRLCTLLTIQRQGYKLRFHPSSFSAGLWVDPGMAVRDEVFVRRYLRPGDVMVDIGANIGTMTLTAAATVAQVFSIEAHPRTFKYLKENVELNGRTNVHLLNVALGAEASTMRFSNLRDDDLNHIAEDGLIPVPVVPLDELSFPTIALLKIDVEGFEKFVFEGGKNTLGKVSCV